jgi:hypothetical protein
MQSAHDVSTQPPAPQSDAKASRCPVKNHYRSRRLGVNAHAFATP